MRRHDQEQAHQRSLIAAMVPIDIRKQLDAEELGDRVAEAARLLELSKAAESPVLATEFGQMARDVLAAQPREVTAGQIDALMFKSAWADSIDQAARFWAAAEQVRAAHPMAPRRRRAVKAGRDGMVAVYNAAGELVGLCDPAKIRPVSWADALTTD